MKHSLALSAALLTAVLLTACAAPRGLAHRATRPVAVIDEGPRSEAERQFTEAFAAMPDGWQGTMSATPFGDDVSLSAGSFYVSGLGQKCRRGYLQDGYQAFQFAVCQNDDAGGSYRVVGPLIRK